MAAYKGRQEQGTELDEKGVSPSLTSQDAPEKTVVTSVADNVHSIPPCSQSQVLVLYVFSGFQLLILISTDAILVV